MTTKIGVGKEFGDFDATSLKTLEKSGIDVTGEDGICFDDFSERINDAINLTPLNSPERAELVTIAEQAAFRVSQNFQIVVNKSFNTHPDYTPPLITPAARERCQEPSSSS